MNNNFYNYFIDANKYKPISLQREIKLAQLIKQKNIKALHELVTANLKIVGFIAKQYKYSNIEFKDALSAGYLALVKAAWKFDITRGVRFYSYAQIWIHKEIKLAIIENDTYRIPSNRRNRLNIYDRVLKRLEHELNRDPSIEEIAIAMDKTTKEKITINKVKEAIRDLNAIKHLSIDHPLNQSTIKTFKDIYVDFPQENIIKQIHKILSNSQILPIQKKILTLYICGYNYDQIGTILNYTGQWIGRLANKAIKKIIKSRQI